MPVTSPVLLIDVGHVAEACVICIRGELDVVAGCPAVGRALKDAEASQAQRLIIDLEQLETQCTRPSASWARGTTYGSPRPTRREIRRGG